MYTQLKGTKQHMTQIFREDGTVVPVTAVQLVDDTEDMNALVGLPVVVSGISKGKGFAGGVKRYSFAGGPKTHGQSDRHRAIGSIGQGTFPGKVWKGKKMPGRMGNEQVTVKGLTIEKVDADQKIVYIKGAVPGGPKNIVTLQLEMAEVATTEEQE